MIISHKHRYVFIELPFTATKALSKELRTYYAGERILTKHSNYHEFLKGATPMEREYFVFASIRNPLDEPVSLFFKYRSTPLEKYYGLGSHGRGLHFRVYRDFRLRRVRYARREGTSFSSYFRRFYKLPYDSWSSVTHAHCDFVIRFENLQKDFSEVLKRLGLAQVRPLPLVHKTAGREPDSSKYYQGPDIERAKRVFGPYMKRRGYTFPESWGPCEPKLRDEMLFRGLGLFRHMYWRHARYFTQNMG